MHEIEAFHLRGGERLRIFLVRLVGETDAEDVVQEAYVRAWRYYETLTPDKRKGRDIDGWIYAIARNAATDWLRHNRRHGNYEDVSVLAEFGEVERGYRDADLRDAVGRLIPSRRGAIEAVYFRGASYDEAAVERDVTPGTLRSLVHRGLVDLRADYLAA